MNKVVKMSGQNKYFDEASDWIVKFDRGLSESERQDFQMWVHQDSKNYDTFMSMAKLWDGMDELSRLSDLFPEPAIEPRKTSATPPLFKHAAIAASMLLAVVISYIATNGLMQTGNVETLYETSVGEHSSVNLSDGSRLVLNTNSLVKVHFDERHRLITLERGEIHINVAHDKSRPLSVKAGNKVVQAVGTAFNIELFDSQHLELIVVDGKVRIGDRTKFEGDLRDLKHKSNLEQQPLRLNMESIAVSKGEKLVLNSTWPKAEKINKKDIERRLSWRTGNIVFKGETLETAISEISRYTSVQFNIMDPDIRNVRLAGLFKTGDVNGLLSALDESFNIASKRVSKEQVNLYRGTR